MTWDISVSLRSASKQLKAEAKPISEDYAHRDAMIVMSEEMIDIAHRLEDLKSLVEEDPPTTHQGPDR